jgi:hypothetical protein
MDTRPRGGRPQVPPLDRLPAKKSDHQIKRELRQLIGEN